MKKTSKLICCILMVVFLIGAYPTVAIGADLSGSCGDGVYWQYDPGTARLIISGQGRIDSYDVFDINTMTSTEPAPWNDYMGEIEDVIIEEGIVAIGASAFKNGYNLKRIELPSTLTHVFNYAFCRCGEVERIVIPANVTYIGCNAFLGRWEESKPYIYFLGRAPEAKGQGTLGRSFSDNTVMYFLETNSEGRSWQGYQADTWNGADFVDPIYTGEAVSNAWQGSWADPSSENYDMQVELTGTQCYTYAYDVINQLNQLRGEKDREPLAIDDKLMETAMRRAAECAAFYSHTRPNGTSALDIFPPSGAKGENIAVGYGSPREVMSAWEDSAGHYKNMVNDNFTSVGVGCFYIDGIYFWAQAFSDGLARDHAVKSDAEKTETISVTNDFFALQTDNDPIAVTVGESVVLPLKLLNQGYRYYPISFQPAGGMRCEYSASIELLEWEPFTVRAKMAGNGKVTVTLGQEASTSFEIKVGEPFEDAPQGRWYYDGVVWATQKGVIDPASTTRFDPEAPMTRETAAILLYRLEGSPFMTGGDMFADTFSDECADAAKWTARAGIMQGYGNGLFGPNDSLTREQMATVLFRYARHKGWDITARGNLAAYLDQYEISGYAVDAMRWAKAEGYITGTSNTTLSPKKANSRAEAATIFMRFSESY